MTLFRCECRTGSDYLIRESIGAMVSYAASLIVIAAQIYLGVNDDKHNLSAGSHRQRWLSSC
jgi:hypothetical protein